jgi:hypothetical protein
MSYYNFERSQNAPAKKEAAASSIRNHLPNNCFVVSFIIVIYRISGFLPQMGFLISQGQAVLTLFPAPFSPYGKDDIQKVNPQKTEEANKNYDYPIFCHVRSKIGLAVRANGPCCVTEKCNYKRND